MSHKEPQKQPEPDRKEKVLHTRIPAALEEEIKLLAEALSIPVSNLVRNIVQDTVGMLATVKGHVDGVVTELKADVTSLSTHVARDRLALRRRWAAYQASGPREPRPADEPGEEPAGPVSPEAAAPPPAPPEALPSLEGILGWQPLTLNVNARCEICGAPLGRGAQAYLGLGDSSERRVVLCPACLPRADQQKE